MVLSQSQHLDISEVQSEAEIEECATVMAESFGTVAREFGLTPENAPEVDPDNFLTTRPWRTRVQA